MPLFMTDDGMIEVGPSKTVQRCSYLSVEHQYGSVRNGPKQSQRV